MPSTLFAAVNAFAPVHSLMRRASEIVVARMRRMPVAAHGGCGSSPPPARIAERRSRLPAIPAAPRRGARPLRVVRVMEAGQPASHGGRMVISGCMADVCAELDRMAAREAALRPGS